MILTTYKSPGMILQSRQVPVDFMVVGGAATRGVGKVPNSFLNFEMAPKKHLKILGFLRGWCSRGGGNWGTLRIPTKDWGTL